MIYPFSISISYLYPSNPVQAIHWSFAINGDALFAKPFLFQPLCLGIPRRLTLMSRHRVGHKKSLWPISFSMKLLFWGIPNVWAKPNIIWLCPSAAPISPYPDNALNQPAKIRCIFICWWMFILKENYITNYSNIQLI